MNGGPRPLILLRFCRPLVNVASGMAVTPEKIGPCALFSTVHGGGLGDERD
jgi:hypothetical protein